MSEVQGEFIYKRCPSLHFVYFATGQYPRALDLSAVFFDELLARLDIASIIVP